jgi:Domain of unknown function (DUF1998)
MAGNRVGKQLRPPDGRVRASQTIASYGPGAMVDLLKDAVLMGGLEFWSRAGREPFDEPRLRTRLKRLFPQLADRDPFYVPPTGDDRNARPGCGIQVLEFPRSLVCQGRDCRRVVRLGSDMPTRAGRYVHGGDCKGHLAPVRFVVACPRGHIDEFPWIWFAHTGADGDGKGECHAPDIKLKESATGDFGSLFVACDACGRTRPMIAAKVAGALGHCRGKQPWLQREDPEPCGESARLLLRTASNSYFAEVASSLDIPEPKSVRYVLDQCWGELAEIDTAADIDFCRRKMTHIREALKPFSNEDVLRERTLKLAGKTQTLDRPRSAEFKLFVNTQPEQPGDYPAEGVRFFARTAALRQVPKGIARVVVAHRLREVRVQTGFTRFEARAMDLQGEYPEDDDLGLKAAPLAAKVRWLPGVQVQGEGFLVQLDEEHLQRWEASQPVIDRVERLHAGYKRWAAVLKRNGRKPPAFYGPRFYLLHSLSHLLIQALSLECGYSAAAIRERIYCSREDDETAMAAILFSTGTTGAEGTLGGLIEEGRALPAHLRRAFDEGTLCSNDPVCAAHVPSRDPTERFLHGAACHGCLFIAEPSCEHFNRFLDRALVFPTLGHERVAFFPERP